MEYSTPSHTHRPEAAAGGGAGEDEFTLLALSFSVLMFLCIFTTIVGNVLVVLSVFTYKPLRVVQNFYIISLACADLAVAVLVMPFNIVNSVMGYWVFGAVFCNMWLTFDVFLCTASILNLCAIAVDRYYAIHDPINYAQKRTLVRVMVGILIVWLASGMISIPPLFGWNNATGNGNTTSLYNAVNRTCQLTDERGYVLYSAAGSFFIPLFLMGFVYVNIFIATRARLRARASIANYRTVSGNKLRRNESRKNNNASDAAAAVPLQIDRHLSNIGLADTILGEEKKNGTIENNEDNVGAIIERSEDTWLGIMIESNKNKLETIIENSEEKIGVNETNDGVIVDESEINNSLAQQSAKIIATSLQCISGMTNLKIRRPNASNRFKEQTRFGVIRPNSPVDTPPDEMIPGTQMSQFLEEKQRISLRKERRAARTMAIIMGAFVLCWLPFFLMYVIFAFCPSCKADTDTRVANFIVWLGYINSTLNPIIYTIFNIDFRRSFKILLLGNVIMLRSHK